MSAHGFDCSPHPCQRVPGFSNTSQQAIRAGIAVLGDAAGRYTTQRDHAGHALRR
jgi:hypothetical protein